LHQESWRRLLQQKLRWPTVEPSALAFFAFSSPIGNAAAGSQPLGPDMRAFVTDSGFDPIYGPVILKIEAPRFAPDVRKPARNE
jgi:hypothetical protein